MPGYRLDGLKAARESAGHSITRLAQLSNTSDQTIQKLEVGGACAPREAQQIADALASTIQDLGGSYLT